MKVYLHNSNFIIDCTYSEKDIAKTAGAQFHPKFCVRPKCFACARGVPKCCWWSKEIGVVARLKQYCDSALLPLIEEHLNVVKQSSASNADIEIPAPGGLSYFPFQKACVAFGTRRFKEGHLGLLIGDAMGCLAGDTIIRYQRNGATRTLPMHEFVRKFNGGVSRSNRRCRWGESPTLVTALKDGELRLHRVVAALDKGIRSVVRITLEDGRSIKATPDHEFAGPGETWIRAENLSRGMTILTNGATSKLPAADVSGRRTQDHCPGCGTDQMLVTYPYAKFKGWCRTCVYRKLRASANFKTGKHKDKDGYIVVSGYWDHPRASRGQIYEHILVMEERLGRFIVWPEQVHHKNENRADNSLDNLVLLTCSEHHRTHGKHKNMDGGTGGRGGAVRFIPVLSTIKNVEPAGEEHVFDLVMDDPYRNFVAGGFIVANCGKTIESLGIINTMSEIESVLVVCPSSLRINWLREATKWLTRSWKFHVVTKNEPVPKDRSFVILSYDMSRKQPLLDSLRGRAWDLVVLDEVHLVKDPKAQRTKAVYGDGREPGLTSKAKRIMAMSGTPIKNRPKEIWTTLRALDPKTWHSWLGFIKRYCGGYQETVYTPSGPKTIWNSDGSSHYEELQDKLRGGLMIRRLKSEIELELPAKRHQIIPLAANGAAKILKQQQDLFDDYGVEELEEEYELAVESGEKDEYLEIGKQLEERKKAAFTELSRLRAELAVEKIPHCIEHIENLLESGVAKLVFMAHHLALLHAVYEKFKGCAVLLTGETGLGARQEAVDLFQQNPDIKLFVGSITAAGVGITLTAADTLVFGEVTWVPSDMDQARDRIHRIGATSTSVLYQYLLFDGSLDIKMLRVTQEKQAVITKTLDGSMDIALPTAQPEKPKKVWPKAPEDFRAAVVSGLRVLSARCDGAVTEDGAGFNKTDSMWGKRMAQKTYQRPLSDGEVWYAARRIWKYANRQLPMLKDTLSLWMKTAEEKPEIQEVR